jgi:hypothetical protein
MEKMGDLSRLIQEITVQRNGSIKVKLYSRKEALDTLAKIKGMFVEDKKIPDNMDFKIVINVPDEHGGRIKDISPAKKAINVA